MKQTPVTLTKNTQESIVLLFVRVVLAGILLALATQLYFVYLDMSGQESKAASLNMQYLRTVDDQFNKAVTATSVPTDSSIFVRKITNDVKIGKLAGNRNLAFGIQNILEEYLQDKGYDLTPKAQTQLDVSIIYLDVLNTKTNISILHKTENEVVIRLRGTLYKDGKKEKEAVVEESSSEISMATLIIDQGGTFNQTSLSNALKKGCDKLITKLFEKDKKWKN